MVSIGALIPILITVQATLEPNLDRVIEGVKKAVHFKVVDKRFQLRLTGKQTLSGVPGYLTFQFDGTGRWRFKNDSLFGGSDGFDGKSYWGTSRSGFPRTLCFSSRDDNRLLFLLLSHQWLSSDSGVDIALSKDQSEADNILLTLKLKDTGKEVKLAVSKSTYLPQKAVRQVIAGKSSTFYSDWEEFKGLKMATSISRQEGGVSEQMTLKGVDSDPFNAADFARLTSIPKDFSFDSAKSSKLEVKKLSSNHFLVHPLINGKDVGWFFLDTGAETMVIDKAAADELGLRPVGEAVVGGIGGVGKSRFRMVSQFELGPLKLEEKPFLELDMDAIIRQVGVRIGGIVGHDVFYRSVISIDHVNSEVNLYNPSSFKLSKGSWTKLLIDGGMPAIEAEFDKGKGWFGIDTGSGSTVLFNAPAVQKLKLLEGRETKATKFGGYGGFSEGRTGVLDWFAIGEFGSEKVPVGFSQAKTGALADTYMLGSIGQPLFRRLVTVFDFASERVAFYLP